MDTRDKIIDCKSAQAVAAQLRQHGVPLKIVTGYFDVLVAAHVRRLRQIADGRSKLLALVLDHPAPLLATRARAELVAGLEVVDYVVPAGEEAAESLLRGLAGSLIVREESADRLRVEHLRQHVQRCHQQ